MASRTISVMLLAPLSRSRNNISNLAQCYAGSALPVNRDTTLKWLNAALRHKPC
jgi:hypothetical protein